jgi:type I restriction enzyme S subunit
MKEEQSINHIPKEWKWVTLRDVCKELQSGKRPKGGVQGITLGIPSIGAEHLGSNGDFKFSKIKFVPNEFANDMKKGVIQKDDIIIVKDGATTGKASFVSSNFPFKFAVINEHVFIVRVTENILPQFAFYKIWSYEGNKEILKDFRGAAQGGISSGFIDKVKIPLPPKEVQQQIVSKIEELFSELDKGIEELKTAQQQLKVYRQAVLNSCIKEDAFQAIGSVIEKLDQGWSPKCDNEASNDFDEWAVIKTTAVQQGYFLDNENKRLPSHLEPRKQHELKTGDLLITRAGPRVRVGVCCLVKHTRPKLLNCDKAYRMKVNSKIALPEYIETVLNSPKYSKEIERMKTGINDSGVNLTQKGFLDILIPVPPLEEQQQIVQEIESRLSVCDKILETITNSLKQSEALRQSILKKAFEGKF